MFEMQVYITFQKINYLFIYYFMIGYFAEFHIINPLYKWEEEGA